MSARDPTIESNTRNEENGVASLFIPRPDFTLPPTASNKTIDEDWALKVARLFFSGSPSARWGEFYSWCADKSDHRPMDYWAELNDNETPLRKKMDKILEGIKESPGSRTKGVNDPRNRYPGFKGYPKQLLQEMVEYLALNPDMPHAIRFWNVFHKKHPQKSARCYLSFHRNHKAYFDQEAERYMEQGGMDPPQEAGADPEDSDSSNESFIPSADDPDCDAHSDSDSDDKECLRRESSAKNKKGHKKKYVVFTDEEREEMRKFYEKMRHKCNNEAQVWEMFSKLHPSRTGPSYQRHVFDHPEIKRRSDGGRQFTHRYFTRNEDKLLMEWGREKGFPKALSLQDWKQFSHEHPGRSFWSWRARYRTILPVSLNKKRERPQAQGEKTVRLASTVLDSDGVVATTSSSSSRVARTYGRANLNSGSQSQRRRRARDEGSEMMGLRSKRLRTMDTGGVNDSSSSPVESEMGNDRSEEEVTRRKTPRDDNNHPAPPAQPSKVEFELPGHPKIIRTKVHQVGSKSGDAGDDDPSNCHTFISVEYGF